MPYDRKTELLWNYLSMAQFTDLSKFWSQGRANTTSVELPDWSKSPAITIRTDDSGPAPGNGTPAHYSEAAPASSANGSPLPSAPVTDELGDIHSRIAAAPYFPLPATAGHSASAPGYGGIGMLHGEADAPHRIVITATVRPEAETAAASAPASSTFSAPAETPPAEDAEPKIYGPSEVAASGSIESSANTQSNDVVNTLASAPPNGWSNAGSDHVGDIIVQMQQAGTGYPGPGFVIDYVHGDLTSLTTVQQLNTIFNNDINTLRAGFTAPEGSTLGDNSLTQSATSGGNTLGNTTVLQGNAALAGYDALVVTGDLTKINRIVQINLIDDTDHNTVNAHADISTPYGTASSIWDAAIRSGGNMEINVGFIIDNATGAVYLVGGTYGIFTSATQVNILSNSDINDILTLFHSQEGTGFLGFSTDNVIRSGGDDQSNQAGFLGSGETPPDGSHADAPPSDLTSLLAFAHLHPTQADGNIHVLFVDGNYTIVNLVIQINVIHDADQNTLDAYASGATGSLTPPPPPADDPAGTGEDSGDGSSADGNSHDGNSHDGEGSGDGQAAGSGPEEHSENPGDAADGTTGDASASPHDGDPQNPDGTGSGLAEDASGPQDHSQNPGGGAAADKDADAGHGAEDQAAPTGADHSAPASDGTAESGSTAGADTPPATANDNGAGGSGSDAPLPVYNDHSSLNYDQIVSSGDNDAGNHATIIDGGDGGPQLTIVQGHYYEYNEIYQVNILIDSDHNVITSAMNTPVPAGSDPGEGSQDTTHSVTADDVLKSMTG